MVEIWPYIERSRGISVFQLFGKMAQFFTTFVNPIGMKNISWKYLITYCTLSLIFRRLTLSVLSGVWLGFEIIFVYFFFPETAGRTLEELTFRALLASFCACRRLTFA